MRRLNLWEVSTIPFITKHLHWNETYLEVYNTTTLRNSHGEHRFRPELEDVIRKQNYFDLKLYEQAHLIKKDKKEN